MKKKMILLVIFVLVIVCFTSYTFATDYNTGSSGTLNGLGAGAWDDTPIAIRVSIVDNSGKLKVAKRVVSKQYYATFGKLSFRFNVNNKPKFLITSDDTINSWTYSNDYILTDALPKDSGGWLNNSVLLNLNSHLKNDNYSNLKTILSDAEFVNKVSSGDFIIIEPMTRVGGYFGTAYELGNSFWGNKNVSTYGSFANTYGGALFGGFNKDGRREGGLFYRTIYLNQEVTELGLTVYNDPTDGSDKYAARNNCLKNKICGRGIGVYKYEEVFKPEKVTLDLNYCVDGVIEYHLPRKPVNFTYDFELNGSNNDLTYFNNSLNIGETYKISNIVVKPDSNYVYKGYNVSSYGNCGVTATGNLIEGSVTSQHTSINLIFETGCSSELKNIQKADGTYDPQALFDLYKKYKGRGNDYRNLLNIISPACSVKEDYHKAVELGCLSASSGLQDDFNQNNLSNYDEIVTDTNGDYVGFCTTSLDLKNNLSSQLFYSKSGQFLIKQNNNTIQYKTSKNDESLVSINGTSIANAKIDKVCYVLKNSNLQNSNLNKNDKSLNVYFGDNNGDENVDELPVEFNDKVVDNGTEVGNSNFKKYSYKRQFKFGLNEVCLDKISGRVSTSCEPGNISEKGIISNFFSSDGAIPFEIIYNGHRYTDSSCLYISDQELVDSSKLNLEFRVIDTSTPFVRTPMSNWNDGNGNTEDNELIQDYIINATNSYGVKNGVSKEPIYRIELSPSDIKSIREYNKRIPYDNYKINCETDENNVTTCENSFLASLKDGYLILNEENGEILNLSNKLISSSN